ncbi:hypothetical protein ACQKIE_18685 [Luteibacter sp. NPDC031894]|uniref:hypothetical protein n=1 Tax=Luteibacter sp. NPDC031894 TaxID=3390572 RepID=UPI003D019CC4
MANYYYAGVAWSSLFAPDTVGDGPKPAGIKLGGVVVHFANISYGSKRPNVMFAYGGVDVSNYWASNGSAVYSLPIDGGNYSANNQQRGQANVRLQMFANGTYQVLTQKSSVTNWTVADSGTWLPAGDSAANYTCRYVVTELGASTIGNASTGTENQAVAQVSLGSANPYAGGYALAALTGTNADCHGSIVMYLYRQGVLRSTTTINYFCNVNGN